MTPKAWKRLFSRSMLWAGIILACTLLFLLANSTWHVYTKQEEARKAHVDEEEQLQELAARDAQLKEQLSELNTARGIEGIVRNRYEVAKSGEQVIVLTNSSGNVRSATSTQGASLWQAFLNWFSW